MRKALLALTLLFLLAHLACLPTTFADIDEINFALGVRHFDVGQHQPHPPGYPVFIAVAKGATALLTAARVPNADVRALSALSALAGALLIPLLFALYRELLQDATVAAWAAVVTALSPLFWFNALRPLSDMSGLAVVVLAQALLISVIVSRSPETAGRRLILGALAAGVAIGVRSQTFLLTLPLLALALVRPRVPISARLGGIAALVAAVLAWMVPLLIVSGGPDAYLLALRNQAGEDFSGVVMLWTMRSARVAINAFRHSFLWPWGTLPAGWIVLGIAIAGAIRMAIRAPSVLAIVVVGYLPYALFHLLFQETVTTRYALPVVIPIALLAVHALAGASRRVLYVGGATLVVWSLIVAVPAAVKYGSQPTPGNRAVADAVAGSAPDRLIAMHAVMRRMEQLYHDNASGRVVRAPHGREVATLVDRWLREPDKVVKFVADPRRSDLALLDPRSRSLDREYSWGFPEMPLLGGVRPGEARLYTLRPPGWMLGSGWAVTAEVGGQTARAVAGPHRRPSIAWIRARDGASTLMIGGRNLGAAGGAAARIALTIGGQATASWTVSPGFFFETLLLPAGTFSSPSVYVPIEVTATSVTVDPVAVSLEQFDLQSEGVPMAGLAEGWHEPEYDPASGRAWHWMSDRATVWVRATGHDVTLKLSAESPLRYFDSPPRIRFLAGDTVLAEISPTADFTQEVRIPAAALAAANERIVIQSDKSFAPGRGDQRKLALRVYAVEVN